MSQNEIILRCDTFLNERSSPGQDFWALVSKEKYQNLKKCVEKVNSVPHIYESQQSPT